MSGGPRAEVLTDQRLEDLERFRDVEFPTWQKDLERRFAESFPGGDHVGHCRYHALMIEGIEWKKRLFRAVMEKTVAGLVWGTIVGIAIAVWQYIKTQVGR